MAKPRDKQAEDSELSDEEPVIRTRILFKDTWEKEPVLVVHTRKKKRLDH